MAMNDVIKGKPSTSEDYHWGQPQILALIKHVEACFDEFYDSNKKKKTIWQNIAQKLEDDDGFFFTGVECDKKWRNLKATYVKVLQKQIHGDISYRFDYFNALHPILGKEIDPLGMREQMIPKVNQISQVSENMLIGSDYQEISVDEGFVWVHTAVNLLLDHVRDCLSNISSPATIQERWEEVADQMRVESFEVDSAQCQRKWEDMQYGYYYHQTKSQATGIIPRWPYFTRVKDLMIALNIPVTVQVDLKPDNRSFSVMESRTHFRKRFSGMPYKKGSNKSILSRVQLLDSSCSVHRRLDQLEGRVDKIQFQQNAYKHTNSILTEIIVELRKINQIVETENSYQYGTDHQQQQQHTARPGSPNQGIIIVEDFSGQL